ncbi:MAG: hypothetical protein AAF368_15255 [Planctomycetota bacterium]
MSDDNKQDPSFQETDLDSPAYRERLLRKLNCLIAVLEVASVKVQKTLKGPEPDVDRLLRIRGNLNKTLDVCMRARKALQEHRQIPEELHKNLSRITADGAAGHRQRNLKALPKGASIELSGDAEKRKFERLGPITADSISEVDFDDLSSQF